MFVRTYTRADRIVHYILDKNKIYSVFHEEAVCSSLNSSSVESEIAPHDSPVSHGHFMKNKKLFLSLISGLSLMLCTRYT